VAYETKYTSKKRMKREEKVHTEDVKNFYYRRPAMGDGLEGQFNRRRGHYGKKGPKSEGPMPLPLTGTIEF
jgi:hypothetical protein